jgi:fructose/tagatose bisphosphate aldolase
MPIITKRKDTLKVISRFQEKKACMAIFCTASHWNTEAILLAASNFAKKYGIEKIPVAVAMTFNYPYMAQAQRVTYSRNPVIGFKSVMGYLQELCNEQGSPYSNVEVLPHLDHADPARDSWALTEGIPYLASVMFDAQKYPYLENMRMTSDYVAKYGGDVVVEGIMEQLTVEGQSKGEFSSTYEERAVTYTKQTKIDLLVADLGTEQQSTSVGKCTYLGDRAKNITKELCKSILVLHGTSSLGEDQMARLSDDGIVRVNMWTRIAREAGQYASGRISERAKAIQSGDFESTESRQYLYDNIEKSAEIMEKTMYELGYWKFA